MKGAFLPYTDDLLDWDPRGVIWQWEPPQANATYVMGVDPTYGIVDWNRQLRRKDDNETDNGAIEVLRIGKRRIKTCPECQGKKCHKCGGQGSIVHEEPDVQVCEYAAPVDPEELGKIANAIGRAYAGTSEDSQCLCIIEVHPGPGNLTLRSMIELGYTNQFVWSYLDTMSPQATTATGWSSTYKSVKALWSRGSKFIKQRKVRIYSPGLIDEMIDAEFDPVNLTAAAIHGAHDDRLRALLLALWAGHSWSLDVETVVDEKPLNLGINYQRCDMTYDEAMADWHERSNSILND